MSIKDNFPSVGPSLSLNFARSKTLDPRITFSRSSSSGDATYMNGNGLIVTAAADEPRFDHKYENGVVKSLGLLVEEQRTNVIQVSAPSPSDISQASTSEGWRDRANLNLEYSSVTSPDGTNNAIGVAYTSAYTTYQVPFIYGDQGTLTSNTSYTLSYWVDDSELVESNNFHLTTIIGTNGWGSIGRYFLVNYNKTSDTFGSPIYATGSSVTAENSNTIFTDISGTVSHYPNNWKRISISFTVDSSYDGYYDSGNTTPDLRFNYGIYMGVAGYTNDNVGNNMKTWGWQLEAGAFPTSYIPTTSSTKTRSPDNVSMTGTNFSDWYNTTEGTIFLDCTPVYDNSTNQYRRILSIHNNSGAQTDVIQFIQTEQSNNVSCAVWDGSSFQTGFGKGNTSGTRYKVAFAVKENNMNASYDGNIGTDATSCTLPAMTQMDIGKYTTGSGTQTTVHINNISYYPKRLTNTQLQNLTK